MSSSKGQIINKKNSLRVIVAMSGGVDSSVAAALLKKRGFDVVGAYLRLKEIDCLQDPNLRDALKVAKILDIPLEIVDARVVFKKKIIACLLDEYKKNRTPNPCVICNPKVKFRALFDLMKKKKASLVATGHYARIAKKKSGELVLAPAGDKEKDQSYFLYALSRADLSRVVFPLENLKKGEVRAIAKDLSLPIHDRPESQDVCFLEGNSMQELLKKNIGTKSGRIVDENGTDLGSHQGLHFFTLGQRKGIDLGGRGPYYAVGKDIRKNRLVVSRKKNDRLLGTKRIEMKNVSWGLEKLKNGQQIRVRTRYRGPLVSAIISLKEGTKRIGINFDERQFSIAPGQSAVFYSQSGEILGGGIINKLFTK